MQILLVIVTAVGILGHLIDGKYMNHNNSSSDSSFKTTNQMILLGSILYILWSILIFTEILTYDKIYEFIIHNFQDKISINLINEISFYFIFLPVLILYSIGYYFIKKYSTGITNHRVHLLVALISLTLLMFPSLFIFSCWANLASCP